MKRSLELIWPEGVGSGELRVHNGRVEGLRIVEGTGSVAGTSFAVSSSGEVRLQADLVVSEARVGKDMTLVTTIFDSAAFTFCVRDVSEAFPILVAEYGVAVVPAGSSLTYEAILAKIFKNAGRTTIQAVEAEPDPTWEEAFAQTQCYPCETILGLTRDHRVFTVSPDMETVTIARSIRYRDYELEIPIGRGRGPYIDLKRWLDDGVLPILHGRKNDGDILYDLILFPTLADRPLSKETVTGTHFLIAEHGIAMEHTSVQEQKRRAAEEEMASNPPAPMMLCYQLSATNTGSIPRPAYLYAPNIDRHRTNPPIDVGASGELLAGGQVYGAVRCDGGPWPAEQIAVMLAPGQSVTAEYRLLHGPQTAPTAGVMDVIWQRSFSDLLDEARSYWSQKLDRAAKVLLPDTRLDAMLRAGYLHLDLATYGHKDGTLAPTVGVYSPIGSESAPIIQFFDSYGRSDLARRSLQYFLDKQHPDGFIQNYGGYMLETGAVLWALGEHYRYTRDQAWVRTIASQVKRSADWIIQRRRDDTEDGQAPGVGMILGKVADPEDTYRSYMLNGYHYLGLQRSAEMLAEVEPETAASYAQEAAEYKADIRRALQYSLATSPVIPLGDGRWVPSCPPWVESKGYGAMGLTGTVSYTHCSVYSRDSLLGPLHLISAEVLEPNELWASFLLEGHYEWMCQAGTAFSQPFYSPHPVLHLRRGERKVFLKALYNAAAGLADRETYSFWEHYYGVSPHKTHEEAWFLMQVRWMLYREEGSVLHVLSGCSRRDFEDGRTLSVQGMRSYFGPVDIEVQSHVSRGHITAEIRCPEGPERGLSEIRLYVFHPDGRRPMSVMGGRYDEAQEMVSINVTDSQARVTLSF